MKLLHVSISIYQSIFLSTILPLSTNAPVHRDNKRHIKTCLFPATFRDQHQHDALRRWLQFQGMSTSEVRSALLGPDSRLYWSRAEQGGGTLVAEDFGPLRSGQGLLFHFSFLYETSKVTK